MFWFSQLMSNLTLTEIRWLIFGNFDEQISNSQILLRLPYIEQVLVSMSVYVLPPLLLCGFTLVETTLYSRKEYRLLWFSFSKILCPRQFCLNGWTGYRLEFSNGSFWLKTNVTKEQSINSNCMDFRVGLVLVLVVWALDSEIQWWDIPFFRDSSSSPRGFEPPSTR